VRWPHIFWMILLLVPISFATLACSGSSNGGLRSAGGISSTSAGVYNITVTGTSGAITQSGTISLIVR
jgi:hypothetical protein